VTIGSTGVAKTSVFASVNQANVVLMQSAKWKIEDQSARALMVILGTLTEDAAFSSSRLALLPPLHPSTPAWPRPVEPTPTAEQGMPLLCAAVL